MVLARGAGGTHAGDDRMRLGAVANQVQLITGEQSFSHQHLLELRADHQHVRGGDQALGTLVGLGGGPGGDAGGSEERGGGTCEEEAEEDNVDELVGGESEQKCWGHAIRVSPCAGYRTQLYAGPMSAGFETATSAVAVSQPRRAVIDRAWRAIGPGVEVLSGDDGGPLRRTVKRILDPLVLRLRSNTQYSAPFVDADTAVAMHELIISHAPQLRSAAAWFELLKRERRRLRITTGNAQELYFPVCFELAVTKGAPAQEDDGSAESVLREVHGDRDRTAIEVLNQYVTNPDVVAALADQLGRSWSDVQAGPEITTPFLAGLTTVLGPAQGHTAAVARQRVWSALIADATPYNLGAKARGAAELPWSITALGLSSVEPQLPPDIVSGSDSERPLNRSVVDRVRATLRRAMGRDDLPDIPMLCAEEVDRSCAPWGLMAEDKQATLIAGIEVGACLAPLSESVDIRYELAAQIQARLRKEAYVLHARRYLADGGGPMHPRQQQVIDDLASFARPYLSRLWARLHGRDVWQEPCDDVDDVRALLEGVARSVSLDHRQRIKSMLELQVAG